MPPSRCPHELDGRAAARSLIPDDARGGRSGDFFDLSGDAWKEGGSFEAYPPFTEVPLPAVDCPGPSVGFMAPVAIVRRKAREQPSRWSWMTACYTDDSAEFALSWLCQVDCTGLMDGDDEEAAGVSLSFFASVSDAPCVFALK